jgi:16S rRNA (cytidine1402-2'-O)-methyltransferase
VSLPKPILFVVGTPIGNLEDISIRALRTLKEADVIACEDTRKTKILLDRHGISGARLISYHKFNEARRTVELLEVFRQGKSVALVTNAGTPALSDPGERLVQAAVENGVRVEVVPGPSAMTAALSISCLPRDEFVFCGFIPSRSVARKKRFIALKDEPRTMVFFETANRLRESLADMLAAFGERKIEIARELTKIHEEIIRTSLSEAVTAFQEKPVKGEIVLIVEGASEKPPAPPESVEERVQSLAEQLGISTSEAVKLVAAEKGIRKQDVYRELLKRKKADA